MSAFWIFSELRLPGLVAQSALARWKAAHTGAQNGGESQDLWLIWAAALVGALVLGGGTWWLVRRLRTRCRWVAFHRRARQLELADEEVELLTKLIACTAVADPYEIFAAEAAFECGAETLVAELAEGGHREDECICVARQIDALRTKLAYADRSDPSRAVSTRKVLPGAELTLVRDASLDVRRAAVVRRDKAGLSVRLARPLPAEPGDILRVQFTLRQQRYEYEANVIGRWAKGIVLAHSDRAHPAQRRQHPPVALRRPAQMVSLSGERSPNGSPLRHRARVVEVAGAWIRMESTLHADVGESVMVELDLCAGEPLQLLGLVRALPLGVVPGRAVTYVVELTDMADRQLERLADLADKASSVPIPYMDRRTSSDRRQRPAGQPVAV